MWTSKTFWKLFLLHTVLILALAAGFLGIAAAWQRTLLMKQSSVMLADIARSIQKTAAARRDENPSLSLRAEVDAFARESPRPIVLVDPQGRILAGDGVPGESRRGEEIDAILSAGASEQHWTEGHLLHVALPVRQSGQLVGALRISQDLADLDQQVAAARRSMVWFIAVAVLVALAASYAATAWLIRPLAQLSEGAQALAADESRDPLPIAASGELGALGTAFTQMQQKLVRRVDQLNENSERLSTVLGNMAEGVIAVSAQEQILLANEASRRLLEITAANPVGRPLLEVTRSLPVHSAVVEALHSPSPIQREFESTGVVRRAIALRATRLPGEPSPGVMLVLHDVTELRRLENLRREFVANVSHELKTPLSSIKAFAETLKMGALNDPEHSMTFVTRIEEQADRLHQLIIDLLLVARMEAAQEAFEIVDVDIAEAVLACLDQYASAAEARRIRLVTEPPGSGVVVRADEEGLRTILSNLVDNAIKYTPESGDVTIRWFADDQAAVLEVEDTGIGIAEKDQVRIFERFYRVDKARSRELGGTGLGLSIVKHLVQAFGGSVGVESQPKQGSTFRIRLPLSSIAEAAA